jgi:hypothetical protein
METKIDKFIFKFLRTHRTDWGEGLPAKQPGHPVDQGAHNRGRQADVHAQEHRFQVGLLINEFL